MVFGYWYWWMMKGWRGGMGVGGKGGWAGGEQVSLLCQTERWVRRVRLQLCPQPRSLLITPPPFVIHTLRHIIERGGFREGDATNGDAGRAQEGQTLPLLAPLSSHGKTGGTR